MGFYSKAAVSTFLIAGAPACAQEPERNGGRANTPSVSKLLSDFDRLSPAEKRAFIRKAQANPGSASVRAAERPAGPPSEDTTVAQLAAEPPSGKPGSIFAYENPKPIVPRGEISRANFNYFLRHDFADLGSLSRPIDVANAQGAEISYTDDIRARNTIWSVKALGAVTYQAYYGEEAGSTDLFKTSFGAYATIDKVLNSKRSFTSRNTDSYGGGGLVEFGISRLFGGTQVFRVRGGGVTDDIARNTVAKVVGEWFPIYEQFYFYRAFPLVEAYNIGARFDPELMAQYDYSDDPRQPLLFNGRTSSLRIGPQVSFILFPFGGVTDAPLTRLSGKVVYHWSYETYSRREIQHLTTALTYNLDRAGHFALSASYKRGAEEETGRRENLFKVALTGKI